MKIEKVVSDQAHQESVVKKHSFSKESLAFAKRELAEQDARADEAFITKMETDKKLDWI